MALYAWRATAGKTFIAHDGEDEADAVAEYHRVAHVPVRVDIILDGQIVASTASAEDRDAALRLLRMNTVRLLVHQQP